MQLENYYELVENAISKFGINPAESRVNDGRWALQKHDTIVWIDIFHLTVDNTDYPYFQVCSPVFKIPESEQKKSQLFEEMLKINDSLSGVAFTIYENWTYIKLMREAEKMDEDEASTLIYKVGNIADRYKTVLTEMLNI